MEKGGVFLWFNLYEKKKQIATKHIPFSGECTIRYSFIPCPCASVSSATRTALINTIWTHPKIKPGVPVPWTLSSYSHELHQSNPYDQSSHRSSVTGSDLLQDWVWVASGFLQFLPPFNPGRSSCNYLKSSPLPNFFTAPLWKTHSTVLLHPRCRRPLTPSAKTGGVTTWFFRVNLKT